MALFRDRRHDIQAEPLDYSASGGITGDCADCVAYEPIVFFEGKLKKAAGAGRKGAAKMLTEEGRKKLLQIAGNAVEAAVYGQPAPKITADEPELQEKCGVFVTLNTGGQLRGCLGQFTSDQPLWELVSQMAAASATQDPRFSHDRLRPDELDDLHIEISVLSPLEKMDDPLDLELGEDGVYIKCGARTGCFLPQVATETGWSKDEFLSYCCSHKAGLPPDAWKDENTEVYCFKAEIIDEREGPSR
jgi:AmmeMemoRadiSam system protein A